MTTSALTNYNATRNNIIDRAMHIVHILGEGESPNATQLTQYSRSLNDMLFEWNADGMELWCRTLYTVTPIAGTKDYNIGIGQTTNQSAPLRIIQGFRRNTSTNVDTPLLPTSYNDYNLLGNKSAQGTPSIYFYDPPRAIQAGGDSFGILSLYVVPDTTFATSNQIILIGHKMMDQFNAATDTLDFPQYFINAVVWGLAEVLSYEAAGLPFAERAMISKMAEKFKEHALGFTTEEGSIFVRPTPTWHAPEDR